MKHTISLALLLASCGFDDTGTESLESSSSAAPVEDDDGADFRAGPQIAQAEHIDKCCPIINGVATDEFCADDIANACPVAQFPIGGDITGWAVVNCFTCGTMSRNCSGTRWLSHGLFGYSCEATSTRRTSNALIDDQCMTAACIGAGIDAPYDECNGACNVPNNAFWEDACISSTLEKSTGAMCCTNAAATTCIPAFHFGSDVPTCEHPYGSFDYDAGVVEGVHFDKLTWCHPCPGTSSGDETNGAWDLNGPPGVYNGHTEYENSVACDPPHDVSVSDAGWVRPTRYNCGGYAFAADGTSYTESCP